MEKSPDCKNPKFFCDICQTGTNNKKDYNKHLITSKHKNNIPVNFQLIELTKKNPKNPLTEKKRETNENIESTLICDVCKKEYKSRVGLWKHRKTCKKQEQPEKDNTLSIDTKQLLSSMFDMIKNHDELIIKLIDASSPGTSNSFNNNNNNNTNSNNSFNLHFFLNETCKNAMNISDFIESIKIEVSDIENVEKVGYVKGVSDIIIKHLNALEMTQRPIHCTDKKREIIYISKIRTNGKKKATTITNLG